MQRWVRELGVLDLAGQRYVVVEDFFGFDVLSMTREALERAWHVGAVGLSEECLGRRALRLTPAVAPPAVR